MSNNSLSKIFALDKLATFFNIIRQNGGIRASLFKLYRQDELKDGRLIGQDKYGNKYFENPRYFYSRNRWVEYSENFHMNYDGSQVPAEWFGWLHYKTDLPPHQVRRPGVYSTTLLQCLLVEELVANPRSEFSSRPNNNRDRLLYVPLEDPSRPKYKWMQDWNENLSGTTGQYVPYSTTRPKVEPWVPKEKSSA